MRSLAKTLVLGTTLATAVIFVAAGTLLYVLVRAGLTAEIDRSLLDKARLLASTVEKEHGRLDLEFHDLDMREFEGSRPAARLQVFAADGSTVYRSSTAGGLAVVPAPDRLDTPGWSRVRLPDGRSARAVSLAFSPRGEDHRAGDAAGASAAGGPLTLVLARSTEAVDRTLARLLGCLLLVGLAAIAASTATLRWFVRRSLRPLERLAAEIGTLGEEDLSGEIGCHPMPREIRPVIERLNDLLRRLDAALQRERAFSADVAHELRNPLAGLRLKMDVAASRTRQPQEYRQVIDECRQIASQMQNMVENLLSLARLEAGRIDVHREPVRLDALIRGLWTPLQGAAEERALRVEWSLEPEVSLVSDPALLGVAVRNLLENAVIHADQGGTIRLRTAADDGRAEVSVANSGSRLSQADAEQAFECFWRGDPARTAAGVHCGLGLSLARKTAAVLGGGLAVESSPGGDFQITLSLPLG